MKRLGKQLAYGTGYLVVLGLIVWGIYSLFLVPAPSCTNGIKDSGEESVDCGGVCAQVCLPNNLRPLAVTGRTFFRPTPERLTTLVRVQNPNTEYGVKKFDYVMTIYDNDKNVLRTVEGSSFIHPAEFKYLLAFLEGSDLGKAALAEVTLMRPTWVAAESFQKPQIAIQDRATESDERETRVVGRVVNKDVVDFGKVTIVALFYGSTTRPIGVSQTEFDSLPANETESFAIIHPVLPDVDPVKTQVLVYAARP